MWVKSARKVFQTFAFYLPCPTMTLVAFVRVLHTFHHLSPPSHLLLPPHRSPGLLAPLQRALWSPHHRGPRRCWGLGLPRRVAFSLLLLQGLVEPRPARARRGRAAHASRRLQVSRHLKKTVLAREILDAFLACVGPGVPVRVLLDSGGVVRDVVRGLPKNLVFFGAIRISAARYAPLTAPWGVRRKGDSLYGLRLDSYSFVPGGYFFSKRNAPPVTA
jgi:hypothetical protein